MIVMAYRELLEGVLKIYERESSRIVGKGRGERSIIYSSGEKER